MSKSEPALYLVSIACAAEIKAHGDSDYLFTLPHQSRTQLSVARALRGALLPRHSTRQSAAYVCHHETTRRRRKRRTRTRKRRMVMMKLMLWMNERKKVRKMEIGMENTMAMMVREIEQEIEENFFEVVRHERKVIYQFYDIIGEKKEVVR